MPQLVFEVCGCSVRAVAEVDGAEVVLAGMGTQPASGSGLPSEPAQGSLHAHRQTDPPAPLLVGPF